MDFILSILVNGLIIFGLSKVLEGVKVEGFTSAAIAALLFAIVNAFIRPLLLLVFSPLTFLTLGLFVFVINALLVMIVGKMMKSFHVEGFWWALIFSIGMSIGSTLIGWFGFPV